MSSAVGPSVEQAASPRDPPLPVPAIDDAPTACAAGSGRRFTRQHLLLALGLVALICLAGWLLPTGRWLRATVQWIDGLGPWGVAIFVAVYALFSLLAIPTSPLNLAAGLLFGVTTGFLAALGAVTAAAVVSFLIARHVARDWVTRRLSCNPKHAAVLKGLRHDSWKMILLTRLNPLLPSAVANYCFGVTPVRFRTYLSASVLGNAPFCLLLAYLGSAGHTTFSGGAAGKRSTTEYLFYVAALVATIGLTIWVTRYTKRKLRQHERAAEDATGTASASGVSG